jgi:hypothetical protein
MMSFTDLLALANFRAGINVRPMTLAANVDAVVAPYNQKRTALYFGEGSLTTTYYRPDLPMTAIAQGAEFGPQSTGASTPWLNLRDQGAVVQREWHAWSAGTPTIVVIETIMSEEDFMRIACYLSNIPNLRNML